LDFARDFGFHFYSISGRAFYLHILIDFLRKQGDARMVRTETINAHRGMIMDRNGVPLAVSTPVTSFGLILKKSMS
jgi:cell division protein FtsI (penicillin-binding protein 3)